MNKPHFETWLQENLVKFCQDAYEKLCAQEQELQLLRLHTCTRRATTREEKIVRPGVYDVCQCVMDEREDNAKLCEHLGAQDYDSRKEYERGYADAMGWKLQNHLEHLPGREKNA